MSDSWDQYAAEWDSNADVILYSEKAFAALRGVVDLEGLVVLDFGCGTGLLTEKMARSAKRVVGLDSSGKMIAVLEGKRLSNVQAIATELSEETLDSTPHLDATFDLIVASSVCAFLPDYEGTLKLLKTLLKPGGILVQWDWLDSGDGSGFGFTEDAVEASMRHAGLEVMRIEESFALQSDADAMPVLMGVARNP